MRVMIFRHYGRGRGASILLSGFSCLVFFLSVSQGVAQQANFGLNLGSGREAIQIDADAMEMRDREGVAVFSGNVSVMQGERLLRAGRMIVHYDRGQGEISAEPDVGAMRVSPGGSGLGSTGIERLEVSGKVYVKSGSQIATGDAGVFDARANTMVMTGEKVVLIDGENIATGCKLTAHMGTGRAVLESCSSATRRGRVSIIVNQNNE